MQHPRLYALLIGVDDYPEPLARLAGCVNDVELIEALLRQCIPPERLCIRKLIAPSPPQSPDQPRSELPTRDNVITALRGLAAPPVERGSCALIYYAGHGCREWNQQAQCFFEGWLPVDSRQSSPLYDLELNILLQAIADRCGDLTVLLDSCFSAGATRQGTSGTDRVRGVLLPERAAAPYSDVLDSSLAAESRCRLAEPGPSPYTVLAACLADETAGEIAVDEARQECHGLFTYSLGQVLVRLPTESLLALRFCDIVEPLRAEIHKRRPGQNPWLLGPAARRLLGGVWAAHDPGIPVIRLPSGQFKIAGGTLIGLEPGALVGLYGDEPAEFTPLGEALDLQARRGCLRIEQATLAGALGRLITDEATLGSSPQLRGRRVQCAPGRALRVRVHSPAPDPALVAMVEAVGRGILASSDDVSSFDFLVGRLEDGAIWIGDELNSPLSPVGAAAPLAIVPPAEPWRMSTGLSAALAHCAQYHIPIRLCRESRGGASLLPTVQLLDCSGLEPAQRLTLEQQVPLRREVRREAHGYYTVATGEPVCILVHNATSRRLFVSLLVGSMEGQLQVLDHGVFLESRSGHLFWAQGSRGCPFVFGCPPGRAVGMDRLFVIATDQRGLDLGLLEQRQNLQEVITEAMHGRTVILPSGAPPLTPPWTAAQTLIWVDEQLGSEQKGQPARLPLATPAGELG